MRTMIALVAVALFATAGRAGAQSWSQFRGPGGSGVAHGQKPPVEFGPDKNLKWKVPAPGGLSSPIVAGDKLVITAFEKGKLYTVAYDRATARRRGAGKPRPRKSKASSKKAAARPSPPPRPMASKFRLLRLVRCDLLRPGRQGTVAIRNAGGSHGGQFRDRFVAHRHRGTVIVVHDELKGSKIVTLGRRHGQAQMAEEPVVAEPGPAPRSCGTRRRASRLSCAGHARLLAYDLKTAPRSGRWPGTPLGSLYHAGGGGGTPFLRRLGRPAARKTISRCRLSIVYSSSSTRTRTAPPGRTQGRHV